jgi:hypothetical protein
MDRGGSLTKKRGRVADERENARQTQTREKQREDATEQMHRGARGGRTQRTAGERLGGKRLSEWCAAAIPPHAGTPSGRAGLL